MQLQIKKSQILLKSNQTALKHGPSAFPRKPFDNIPLSQEGFCKGVFSSYREGELEVWRRTGFYFANTLRPGKGACIGPERWVLGTWTQEHSLCCWWLGQPVPHTVRTSSHSLHTHRKPVQTSWSLQGSFVQEIHTNLGGALVAGTYAQNQVWLPVAIEDQTQIRFGSLIT